MQYLSLMFSTHKSSTSNNNKASEQTHEEPSHNIMKTPTATTLDASGSISNHQGQRLLQLEQVECLVESALAATNHTSAQVQEIRFFLEHMHGRLQRGNKKLHECRNSMMDVIPALEDLVSGNSPHLPSAVVYEMHSCIGLLHLYCEQYAAADAAFVKALWVATSLAAVVPTNDMNNNKDSTSTLFAMYKIAATARTLHRLGVSHVQAGDYDQGRVMLEKALGEYCKTR